MLPLKKIKKCKKFVSDFINIFQESHCLEMELYFKIFLPQKYQNESLMNNND